MGRRAWRARGVDGAAVAVARHLSAFWASAIDFERPHRGHRRATGRSLDQHHQARYRRERHGRVDPRTWRRPGSNRQSHLHRSTIFAHGRLFLCDLVTEPWKYEPAQDLDKSLVERLKNFPREPDMLVYGARSAAATAIRMWLRVY